MSDSDPSRGPDCAREPDASTRDLELRVPEMDCPSCAGKVTNSVNTLEGIEELDTAVTTGRVHVTYDPTVVSADAIEDRVRAAGYDIAGEPTSETVEFSVPEMDCPSCAGKVTSALDSVSGVDTVETQPTTGRVTVSTTGRDVDPAVFSEAIESAGYEPTLIENGQNPPSTDPDLWRSRRALGTALGALLVSVGMVLAFLTPSANALVTTVLGRPFLLSDALFVVAATIAGYPILRNGYYSARNWSLDIDFLMSAGIVASVATHHPFEGAMLAVLFSIAQLLERFSMDRARNSLEELMDLSPETATVRRDGEERTVPAEEVVVGDLVIVRPGEKIPTDGVVADGTSTVDQAPVTGESVSVDKYEGESVYSGTINETGYLEIEATSPVEESTIARIVQLVEEAQREKTDREQFVDRFASVYTPIVVTLAVAVAIGPPIAVGASWNTWFLRGLTLLVISCPCAFVISTPVSVVSGITSAARNGVLLKSGRYLEAVEAVDVVAVDKTGTLTTGELAVTDVVALDGASDEEVLRRAGAIERQSEHPIAEAIVDNADERNAGSLDGAVTDFESLTGEGVRATVDGETHYVGKPDLFGDLAIDLEHTHATDGGELIAPANEQCARENCVDVLEEVVPTFENEGKTVVLVGTEERILGVIAIADTVRPNAAWTISKLQDQGIRTVMLTGDNVGTARAIADEVGIDEFHAELLPEEKLEWIRRFDDGADDVAMVGDGINDAPALATASVGIAMGAAGTDTALETADVALMSDDLTRLPYLFSLSSRANGVIRQNIWSSLVVKAILAAGAPFGIVTVIHAVVIGDMGMSLGVTGNAMRLSGIEPETPDDTHSTTN